MTVAGPVRDEDVPAFWQALGLPGIVDVHVHFMPERLMHAVWRYFDSGGALVGREWPIAYRWDENERLAHLRRMGVRAFPALLYPHRPGMAEALNEWAAEFADRVPECLRTATFFAEESAADYVERAVRGGVRLVKVHLQVGGFDPRDPVLRPVWGLLAEAKVPVVVHCGDGPVPGPFTGPGPIGAVLAEHPALPLIVAHLGMPDPQPFLDLAERYPEVRLDTTMAFVEFSAGLNVADDADVVRRLAGLRDKVLLGTDFPNIPYAYAHQLDALARLGLGDDWLRAVCHDNAARLFALHV